MSAPVCGQRVEIQPMGRGMTQDLKGSWLRGGLVGGGESVGGGVGVVREVVWCYAGLVEDHCRLLRFAELVMRVRGVVRREVVCLAGRSMPVRKARAGRGAVWGATGSWILRRRRKGEYGDAGGAWSRVALCEVTLWHADSRPRVFLEPLTPSTRRRATSNDRPLRGPPRPDHPQTLQPHHQANPPHAPRSPRPRTAPRARPRQPVHGSIAAAYR